MGNHDFPGQNTVGVAIGSGPRSFPKKRLSLDSIKDEKFYEFFKIRFNTQGKSLSSLALVGSPQ